MAAVSLSGGPSLSRGKPPRGGPVRPLAGVWPIHNESLIGYSTLAPWLPGRHVYCPLICKIITLSQRAGAGRHMASSPQTRCMNMGRAARRKQSCP
jgi:hypothetical protein